MFTHGRVVYTWKIVLLVGALLGAYVAASAQVTGNASSQAMQASPAPSAVTPEAKTVPPAAVTFEDLVRTAEREGKFISLREDISQAMGLLGYSQMAPEYFGAQTVHGFALEDTNTEREVCVIQDTHEVLFITKAVTVPMAYLASSTGVLRKAVQIKLKGRLKNEVFETISLRTAAPGFDAERQFWMNKVASGHAAGNPD